MSSSDSAITKTLWAARIPLLITHASSASGLPFVTSVPRFSYLALLLPRLSAFFACPCSSFHFEDVQLRNLPVGLLVDLYQPEELPFRLMVSDGLAWDMSDTFLNSAKEADFVRYGTAKQMMKMSKEQTTQLWQSVVDNDLRSFAQVHAWLLNAPAALQHVPLRVYIPDSNGEQFRIVQTLVPATGPPPPAATAAAGGGSRAGTGNVNVTLGQALKNMMPRLFPSSRDPVLAGVVMHGAAVPFGAPLVELMREAVYPDGWLCLVVRV